MKRMILAGVLVMAVGASGLMAKKDKKNKDQEQPAQAQSQPAGPHPKSKAELEAVQALISAQGNPDATIAAAENLVTKFADTDYKDTALFMEAQAYRQKGDRDKAVIYGERTLATNPKNYQASLMLAELTVQGTRETDLDKADKLAKADKYANDSITAINEATKPNPQITDEQWGDLKKDMIAQAHDALGMSALNRKDYNAAIDQFKQAIDGAAHVEPAYEVRLASAYYQAGKNDEAVTLADKVMAEAQTPQQIKSVAQAVRAGAIQAKNKAGKGSNASAPPQVQINKQP